MVRVLRYPRLSAAACAGAIACALGRDVCVQRGLHGWAGALLAATLLLLLASFALLSCRLFVDAQGVGVGFLLRVRRASWTELAALGALCCNSRRRYLYGLYQGHDDFLQLLHRAPACGEWGFVAPLGKRLAAAVQTYCPYPVDLTPRQKGGPAGRLRPLWHQAVFYLLMMLPAAALAFLTATLMMARAAGRDVLSGSFASAAVAMALCAAGLLLLNRAAVAVATCPRISEQGVCAGHGLYLPWEEVRFGFVRRAPQGSGLFLLSETLETVRRRGAPPVYCLSLPDTSTLMLAYLTYCPHAPRELGNMDR